MSDHLETKFAALSAKSRRLLIDAAVCFVATWLIAFLPPQWKNGEALKEIAFTTDPVSGKIIDRIASAQTERPSLKLKNASPAPALFAVYPQERISDWSTEAAAEKTETIPVRPTKVVALRKSSPEKRNPVEVDAAGAPDLQRRAARLSPVNGRESGATGTEFVGQARPDRALIQIGSARPQGVE